MGFGTNSKGSEIRNIANDTVSNSSQNLERLTVP